LAICANNEPGWTEVVARLYTLWRQCGDEWLAETRSNPQQSPSSHFSLVP